MITEDYVSFETAKLLKEKGFEGFTLFSYSNKGSTMCGHWENEIDWLPKCTLQMAMKWLREVYKLHIEPHIQTYKNYNGNIYNLDGELLLGFTGESPEQACEVAIKYCLKHLI